MAAAEVDGAAFSLSASEQAAIAGCSRAAEMPGGLEMGSGGGAGRVELDWGGERPWVFERRNHGGRI